MKKRFQLLVILTGIFLFVSISIVLCSDRGPLPMQGILMTCEYYLNPFYARHGFFPTDWNKLLSNHKAEKKFRHFLSVAGDYIKHLTPITFTLSGRVFKMSASYKTFLKTHTYKCKIIIEYGGLDYYCLSTRNSEAIKKRNYFEDHCLIIGNDIKIPDYYIESYVKSPRHFSKAHIIETIFPYYNYDDEYSWNRLCARYYYPTALIYVGFLKRKDAIDEVVKFLSDKSEEVQCAAIWALGQLGLPEYASKLKENLKDTESLNIKLNTLLSLNLLGEDIGTGIRHINSPGLLF
jgi:hypothetical protein